MELMVAGAKAAGSACAAVQEDDDLGAGTAGVRTEHVVPNAGGNAAFRCPGRCAGIPGAVGDIAEAAACGGGSAGRPVQEGQGLPPGNGGVGRKGTGADAPGNAVFHSP